MKVFGMKNWQAIGVMVLGALILGCASEPTEVAEPPQPDPATAKADYWLAKPPAASVFYTDYDKLWDTCGDVARDDLFTLDRQDYRDGLLTTHPMVSKQFFEPWRNDAGDGYDVAQNSLQTIRRTIEFEFDKFPGGATVTPKVLIEKQVLRDKRLASAANYRNAFGNPEDEDSRTYWYAIGRDPAMEAELAKAIKEKL